MGPNIIRNSIINAAEIATFDQVRAMILHKKLMEDGLSCHLVSSSIAGFVAAFVGSHENKINECKTRIIYWNFRLCSKNI